MPTGYRAHSLRGTHFSSFSHLDFGDRSAEGVAALTRHAQIQSDAERRRLIKLAPRAASAPGLSNPIRRHIDRLVATFAPGPKKQWKNV